jgi:hypothetical protein
MTIIGLGTKADPNSLELFTKDRKRIPNTQPKEDAPARLKAAKDMVEKGYPSVRMRSLSATYDCVGMVLASRRTRIGAEHLKMILNGDGYHRMKCLRVTLSFIRNLLRERWSTSG